MIRQEPERTSTSHPSLARALGPLDGTLLTIGSIVGTGIFLTAGDVARAVPSPMAIMAVWLAGGLLTLAGALTYGELGAMFPRAGGVYHYLREAWGPIWGFFFGWSSLLVLMSGGIAAIAVGFGEYFGTFVPALASERVVWSIALARVTWSVSGAQLSGVIVILALTVVNHFGVRFGAFLQNALTILKIGAVLILIAAGLFLTPRLDAGLTSAPSPSPAADRETDDRDDLRGAVEPGRDPGTNPGRPPETSAVLPGGSEAPADEAPSAHDHDSPRAPDRPPPLITGLIMAVIAALWTYDGWFALTASAGEMRRPQRDLPLALVCGVSAVIVLYLLVNMVYLRAMPLDVLAGTTRAAEVAAVRLLGGGAARLVCAVVALSAFGCLASTILYTSRIYQPMAADGLFFASVGRIHPRWRTPTISLWLQSAWAVVLALTGTYTQLFTYVTFSGVILHALAGLAVFRLRVLRPGAERPYRVWGYPFVPALFVLVLLAIAAISIVAAPRESVLGLLAMSSGFPLYALWRRRLRNGRPPTHAATALAAGDTADD